MPGLLPALLALSGCTGQPNNSGKLRPRARPLLGPQDNGCLCIGAPCHFQGAPRAWHRHCTCHCKVWLWSQQQQSRASCQCLQGWEEGVGNVWVSAPTSSALPQGSVPWSLELWQCRPGMSCASWDHRPSGCWASGCCACGCATGCACSPARPVCTVGPSMPAAGCLHRALRVRPGSWELPPSVLVVRSALAVGPGGCVRVVRQSRSCHHETGAVTNHDHLQAPMNLAWRYTGDAGTFRVPSGCERRTGVGVGSVVVWLIWSMALLSLSSCRLGQRWMPCLRQARCMAIQIQKSACEGLGHTCLPARQHSLRE